MDDGPRFSVFRAMGRALRALFLLVFFLIICILSVNVFVYSQTRDFIFPASSFVGTESVIDAEPHDDVPPSEVAILLGASVFKNGELTPVLSDRADMAIDLYKKEKVEKILVTGDNSTKYYNEVTPTKNYLIKHGVPESDILVDSGGVDTYQSMYRAKNMFDVNSALVVSQRFHLSRAVYIAKHLGIDAYGVSADQRTYNIKNDFREIFATIKSVFIVGF